MHAPPHFRDDGDDVNDPNAYQTYRYDSIPFGFANRGTPIVNTHSSLAASRNTSHQDPFYSSTFSSRGAFMRQPIRGRFGHGGVSSHHQENLPSTSFARPTEFGHHPPVSSNDYGSTSSLIESDVDLSAIRILSDNAVLVTTASKFLDEKQQPKRITKACRAQRALCEAVQHKREMQRSVEAARRAAQAAADDDEDAIMILELAELAASEAADRVDQLKKARDAKVAAEYKLLKDDEKKRATERVKPVTLDVSAADIKYESSDEEEEEEEPMSDSDENDDIAYADGLRCSPASTPLDPPFVPEETISAFRRMTNDSDRYSKIQKKAKAKDVIHRAELIKRREGQKKKQPKKTKKRAVPDVVPVETPGEKKESASGDETISDKNTARIAPLSSSTTTASPVLNTFLEDKELCRFITPWFEEFVAAAPASSSTDTVKNLKNDVSTVISFLDKVEAAIAASKKPLQIMAKQLSGLPEDPDNV